MGQLHEFNNQIDEAITDAYTIRVPLKMLQITEKDGHVLPLAFYWKDNNESMVRVKIDRVITVTPSAERKSGAVGDCYECEVQGRIEYLYYSKLQPHKWFIIQKVSKEEYNNYYKLQGWPSADRVQA